MTLKFLLSRGFRQILTDKVYHPVTLETAVLVNGVWVTQV